MKSVIQMLVALDLQNRRTLAQPPKPIQWIPTDAERRAQAALKQSARTHVGRMGTAH